MEELLKPKFLSVHFAVRRKHFSKVGWTQEVVFLARAVFFPSRKAHNPEFESRCPERMIGVAEGSAWVPGQSATVDRK
jgi:hypothetical protein